MKPTHKVRSVPSWLKRKLPFAVALLAAFVAAVDCKAEEKAYQAENFAITVPSNWEEVKDLPHTKVTPTALFMSPDRENLFFVTAQETPENQQPVSPVFVFGFEKSLQYSTGGKPLTSRYFEISGVKAYERTGVQTLKGKKYATITQVMVAGGRTYVLQGMRPDGSGSDDQQMRSILTSFHFLTPPKPVDEFAGKSDAFRIGYYVGRAMVFVILVVAAISIIIVARRNSKGSKPPPLPPIPQG